MVEWSEVGPELLEALYPCCNCGAQFRVTGNGRRCPPCRREYETNWRKRRREAGLSACGSHTWDAGKYAAWKEEYYSRSDVRDRRAAQMRGYAKDPKLRHKHEARWKTWGAITSGQIIRQPCAKCGAPKAQAHHNDYTDPLNLTWLCLVHHREFHTRAEEISDA